MRHQTWLGTAGIGSPWQLISGTNVSVIGPLASQTPIEPSHYVEFVPSQLESKQETKPVALRLRDKPGQPGRRKAEGVARKKRGRKACAGSSPAPGMLDPSRPGPGTGAPHFLPTPQGLSGAGRGLWGGCQRWQASVNG